MRLLILTVFTCCFWSCSTDDVIPCSEDGIPGELCRVYRFYNDDAVGYTEFDYQGDTTVIQDFYSPNSRLQKSVVERFVNARLVALTEQFPEEESRVQTFHYNDFDSLFLVVYGANDSSLVISYENVKRKTEDLMINAEVIRRKEYRYFQDGGDLYRVSFYLGTDSLLRYQNYDYFSGNGVNQYRESVYNPDFSLIGRRLYTFTQSGLIKSMEFRLENGTVAETANYIYSGSGKLEEAHSELNGIPSKSIYVYRQ